MEKYKSFEKILTNLNILRYIIYSKVNLGFYDTNKQVEDLFKDLLNKVYGWELENKNDKTSNFPGIDLGCKKNRVAIQVTSQNNYTKIDKTLDLFDKHHMNEYDRVIIFILTKKSNHSKDFTSKVKFSKDNDILDIDDLLTEIEKKETIELEAISKYIEREIPYYIGKITSEKDILRQLFDYSNIEPRNFLKYKKISTDVNKFNFFKKKTLEIHKEILSLSHKQRKGLFVFLSKCNKESFSLNTHTWGDILRDSFDFKTVEIVNLCQLFQEKMLIDNDCDENQLKVYDCNFWNNITFLINNDHDLFDFVVKVNFSLIDE